MAVHKPTERDRYPFFSPSTRTTITVRVLVRGTPPVTYVPAGIRESLLWAPGRPCSGNGVGTGSRYPSSWFRSSGAVAPIIDQSPELPMSWAPSG
jgi:hypothetical protein